MSYQVEAGIETKTRLTTIKRFTNAADVKAFLKSLPEDVWYVVENGVGQKLVERNYMSEGVNYAEGMVIPKALLNL